MTAVREGADLPAVVYTHDSQLRTPGRLLRSMWADLEASRELAWRLFVRDISSRYRDSALGIFWSFMPALTIAAVFIVMQRRQIVHFGHTDIPYALFALVGTLFWQMFAESLNAPIQAVQGAKPMLQQIRIPKEAVILAAFYGVIFNSLIKLMVVAGIVLLYRVPLGYAAVWAFPVLLLLNVMGVAVGLFFVPLGMIYSDFVSMLGVLTPLWFLATPVVYQPPTAYPYSLIMKFNPVSPLLAGARDAVLQGALTHTQGILWVSCAVPFALLVAWVLYRVAIPIVVERWGI